MSEFGKLRKKIKKDFETEFEVNPDSEFPVHEKRTRQKKLLQMDEEEDDDEERSQEEE